MSLLGRALLTLIRSFHHWHTYHLAISLGLTLIGLMGVVVGSNHYALASLPKSTEHVLHVGTQVFFATYLLLITAGRVAVWRWPPPIVPLMTAIPTPISKPESSHWMFRDDADFRYRFRYACRSDLGSFVNLAMADPAIVMTYSYLSASQWEGVYRRWHELLPHTLAVMERQLPSSATWSIAAVSIIVPLSRKGAEMLWSGEIGTADIDANHVSHARRASAYLVDLLAAERGSIKSAPQMVMALPKVHLAHLSAPWLTQKMEIWIEPVHHSLPRILSAMGFEGPHTTRYHTLYSLVLPPRGIHFTSRQKQTAHELLRAIHECASWNLR